MSPLRVLVANFFPAFHPPRSGGEQRYHYFYRHLSRHYDVTLLSPTYSNQPFEEVRFSPTFRELRIPKDPLSGRLHLELHARGIGPECSAYVVALASGRDDEYARRFAAAAVDADAVVHESPFTLAYDRTFGIDGKPRIYNAYNVEHRLARQILRGEAGAEAARFIRFLEARLARNAGLILATSDEDRLQLAADFGVPFERIALAPNGFEPPAHDAARSSGRDPARVVFVGSAHPPNVEAARFIADRLAPAMPDVRFIILGAVCDALRDDPAPPNVKLLGFVSETVKARELHRCGAAINPMFSGSGTNLKLLEYLAAGAPTVTTPIGARGLALTDGTDAVIADAGAFADRLGQLLADEDLQSCVGQAGREKAYARFTWRSIADDAHAAMRTTIERRDGAGAERPLLLHVNDFPVRDAAGGGEVRIRELLRELGREFDVVLLCLAQEAQRSEHRLAANVLEIRIPKSRAHRDAEVAAARGEAVSVNDLVAAEFCPANEAFVAAFRLIGAHASAVVFEHPYLSPLIEFLPAGKPVVYSSLNVESRLKASLLQGRRDGARRMVQVRDLERTMLRHAALTTCVSNDDLRAFREDAGEGAYVVIENGVRFGTRPDYSEASKRSKLRTDRPLGVFIGSAHPPNAEAARFLIEAVAVSIPQLQIVIVGSVCSALGARVMPANVHLVGILPDAVKNELLACAHIALNPLFQGGGSSLKVPDFLASGLPMISTRTGVRGYSLEDGEHYVEASRATFVERTRSLLDDRASRERIARNARRYAERMLDWTVLGHRYRRAVNALIARKPKPRVLVLTYRFADPPPGGAETFLVGMLKGLHARGNCVLDIAACDIGTIANKWHFSADYGRRSDGAPAPAYVDALFRFAPDAPPPDTFECCRRLFRVWMDETRAQALLLLDDDRTLLLGGWNFPERHGAAIRRWTSGESHVQVHRAATMLRVAGHAPAPVVVDIRRDGATVASRRLSGRFEWKVAIGTGSPVVALVVTPTRQPEGDPRELGIVVDALACGNDGRWHSIALDEDFEACARRTDSARWVRSLVAITERRSDADDELFGRVRGPHSPDLARWLEENLGSYDVVLAQGTPFSTPLLASDVAWRHGVPLVHLPHFHMEDRYYHWRSYYGMFRRAHRVIAAPESLKSTFFDVIGAPSIAIPGGGIDPGEFEPAALDKAERAFCALHHGSTPFVLVLGRKTGAKHYRLVVDAVAALNVRHHRLDVVLIGPDEDGIALTQAHTFAYGAQSRAVVLGALKQAVCLVNMSESESFGIVLLESWLAGRPVIVQRRCAAFTDLVETGVNGFLAATEADLAGAIDAYLTDEACALQHARAGRAIAQVHAWSHIAERIEAILMEATRGPARTAESGHHPEHETGTRTCMMQRS